MTNETSDPQPTSRPRARQLLSILVGLGVGAILFGFAVGLKALVHPDSDVIGTYGTALIVLVPLAEGLGLGLSLGPKRIGIGNGIALIGLLYVVQIVFAVIFLREGVICLIIGSPLLLGLTGIGAWIGRAIAHRRNRTLQVSLVPLMLVLAAVNTLGPRPDKLEAVSDSVVVDAPPAAVWRYIVSYPENTAPPEYWLWRIGLPEPVQSVAEAPAIGAKRQCRFTKGMAFEERIVELTPDRSMTFAVTKQPDDPEAMGHFRFDKGQLILTPLPGNRTRLTAISWYELYVQPYAYFNWWTTDIVRQVHFRVMNHMKALAERDYRQAT